MHDWEMALKNVAEKEDSCLHCMHYFITHEVTFPYGCRALAFKSRRMPSREVLAASHEPCQVFRAKERFSRP